VNGASIFRPLELRFSPYFHAVDHFENCVGALHRLLLHLDQLRRGASMPGIDRTTWRSLNDAMTRLKDARDATEHMSDRLAVQDPSTLGPFPFLNARKADLEIEGTVIRYTDLASWIPKVYAIVQELANDVPPTRSI
jgi:hypothetical protein